MNFYFRNITVSLFLLSATFSTFAQTDSIQQNPADKLIAHRGLWSKGYPQNSKQGIEAALNSPYCGFECDIQQSADGILFLNHDNEIGDLIIVDTDYKKLKDKNPEILPLLSEILLLKKEYPGKVMYAEVKNGKASDILNEFEEYGISENLIFKSFNKDLCLEMISITDQPVYLLSANSNIDFPALKEEGFSGVSLMYEKDKTSPSLIKVIHDAGLKAAFWTINDEAIANQLYDWGADHIISDITF